MTNIISFQKPGITRITAAFFAAFALCDIGSIHPADIFSVLIFAGMLLLFSPTLTQRLTNIGAASSVLPRHFYPICRLLAVLYTLFYAAAKHAELSGSFDSRIFRLAFLAAAEQLLTPMSEQGVLLVCKPFSNTLFLQAIHMAAASNHRLQVLRQENARMQEKLQQVRLVSRAKCCLIAERGMSEAEAHRYIEKNAMDTRRDRAEIAQEILDSYDPSGV